MDTAIASRIGLAALAAIGIAATSARAVVIESFETGVDGWAAPASGGNSANFAIAGTTATGATDGLSSLAIGPTAGNAGSGPNYGQLILSPTSTDFTAALAQASALSFDVTVPAAAFGYFLQFDLDINNSGTGYQSLLNYNYQGANVGGVMTITAPISQTFRDQLLASGTGTQIIVQAGGGFSAGNEAMYIDNFRTTLAPEPASLSVAAACTSMLLRRRRA